MPDDFDSSSSDDDDDDHMIDALSASLSLPATVDSLSLTSGRAEIVTSCLGRRSGGSRGGSRSNSAMTTASSSTVGDTDVETIQWKRGNMLGKGG